MADIIQLAAPDLIPAVEEFLEKLKRGEVTHGICIYRETEGNLTLLTVDPKSVTHNVGLLVRAQHRLLDKAASGWED